MNDSVKVIVGIIIFLLLVTSPLWYNLAIGSSPARPELELPPNGSEQCVADADWMRAYHMDLLNDWRDQVVRDGERKFTIEATGQQVDKSLTLACLDCHSNKAQFCDACHNYMAVSPYCWDCHVVPKEAS